MGNVDVVSRLPDDLLISILSRLTLKQAMTTSVLSRHWEKLWTFYHGNLHLQYSRNPDYVTLVNKIVDTLEQVASGDILDSFTIRHDLCPDNFRSVDRWVRFALEKRRVKRLVLDKFFNYECDHTKAYEFPHLQCFNPQQGISSNIQGLTSISFHGVNVSGEIIERLLSTCPLLQSLDLVETCKPLVHLRIVGETLALRHMSIDRCYDLTDIELSAPNLVSLNYYNAGATKVKFDIRNVPMLVKFTIGIRSPCPNVTAFALCLLTRFSQIQKLELGIYTSEEPMDFTGLTEVTSVKHLTIKIFGNCCRSILAWIPLLKAFPVLQKFTLGMYQYCGSKDGIDGLTRWHEAFPNKHLKVFEFLGFGESSYDVELVMRFLNNIATLKKILLLCYGGQSGIVIPTNVDKSVRRAAELEEMMPEKVDLVISKPPIYFCPWKKNE